MVSKYYVTEGPILPQVASPNALYLYGLYASLQNALTTIEKDNRAIGLKFGILQSNNTLKEYWFNGGTEDSNAVPFISNITTLGGTLNLAKCPKLKYIYAKGTALTQIALPVGGPIKSISYPSSCTTLNLNSLPSLTTANCNISSCAANITDVYIVNCPNINPFTLLKQIYDAQSSQGTAHKLKRIRISGFNNTYNDTEGSDVLSMLSSLADGTYWGLDAEGLEDKSVKPILIGSITLNCPAYQEDIDVLSAAFPNLTLKLTGEVYIKFEDENVKAWASAKFGDGTGVTKQKAAQSMSENLDGTDFSGFTGDKFNEFKYFTKCKTISQYGGIPITVKELTFPSSLYQIYRYNSALRVTEKLTLLRDVFYVQDDSAIKGITGKVYVPNQYLNNYKAHNVWSTKTLVGY